MRAPSDAGYLDRRAKMRYVQVVQTRHTLGLLLPAVARDPQQRATPMCTLVAPMRVRRVDIFPQTPQTVPSRRR